MEFIDLATQQQRIQKKISANIQAVLTHGKYIMGPEVKELEEKLAAFVGADHAIGCASGTDALLLALMSYGIGPGDAVLTSPFTFISTAEVISILGATPVFVDIDPTTFNVDSSKLKIAIKAVESNDPSIYPLPRYINKNATKNTLDLSPKGIIAVDLFGLPADYDTINDAAKKI